MSQIGFQNNWEAIIESTQKVLEGVCADSLNTELHQTDNITTTDGLASSVVNGNYIIKLDGISQVEEQLNAQFNVYYTVILEITYQLSAGNPVEVYNNAISDLEVIVRERLKQDSWTDYTDNINIVTLNSVGRPQSITKGEGYIMIPVTFIFQMLSAY